MFTKKMKTSIEPNAQVVKKALETTPYEHSTYAFAAAFLSLIFFYIMKNTNSNIIIKVTENFSFETALIFILLLAGVFAPFHIFYFFKKSDRIVKGEDFISKGVNILSFVKVVLAAIVAFSVIGGIIIGY